MHNKQTFELIDRPTKIDPDAAGYIPEKIEGNFEFKDIAFTYPARPDQPIFTGGFNLSGKSHQTIALVGASGCGKSTTIGMIQRWYDANEGTINVDGQNVKSYQLKEGLRHHMALVGQEPVLFDMSIKENILWGTDRSDVTDEEIQKVAKMANIHTFADELPQGNVSLLRSFQIFSFSVCNTRPSYQAMRHQSETKVPNSPAAKNSASPSPAP